VQAVVYQRKTKQSRLQRLCLMANFSKNLKKMSMVCCKSLSLQPENFLKKNTTMANHSATKKDVRQSRKRNERNRYYGKTTRNAIRDIRAIDAKAAAADQLPAVESMIDKLAKRGTIHKNKAANLKSKLAKKINALAK
jgi:small subunit ribosomal protein S20